MQYDVVEATFCRHSVCSLARSVTSLGFVHSSLLFVVRVTLRKVLEIMASNDKQVDEKAAVKPAPRTSFCQRNKSGNGSVVSRLRNHIHEFIHASVDEHRTCLRNTVQKIIDASKNFRKGSDSSNEGQSSLPLQSSTKN